MRKSTSGKHHLARLALSRAGSEGKRAKCDSSNGIGGKKREKIQHPRKAVKKIKTQADIRHAFYDPAHGSRVRLSPASQPEDRSLKRLWSTSGKRSTTTPCQWMHVTGAVSKADVTLLQPTVLPFHLMTFRPFSYRLRSTRCRQTSTANTVKSSPSTNPKTLNPLCSQPLA